MDEDCGCGEDRPRFHCHAENIDGVTVVKSTVRVGGNTYVSVCNVEVDCSTCEDAYGWECGNSWYTDRYFGRCFGRRW